MNGLIALFEERAGEIGLRTAEHVALTVSSTGLAILVGVPLGILAHRRRRLRAGVLGLAGILQTVPSLALLAILLTVFQRIGALPAVVALTLYAILPIVRNTLSGLNGVPPAVIEAATGVGMSSRQRLRRIELPLALPVIIAGIRTAAVVNVGIATLSAFIGAGGLGQFINRGLALSNTDLILLGAIPAALLALVVDATIAALQWALRSRPALPHRSGRWHRRARRAAFVLPVLLVIASVFPFLPGPPRSEASLVIGTKNFTEQLILGEILAQLVESRTSLDVRRRFNLGGTMICHEALKAGEIDLYVEYSGTALSTILHEPPEADPARAQELLVRDYRRRFALEWSRPLGFDNTYTLAVRREDAESMSLETLSDLAAVSARLEAGFTAEFNERPDGLGGLRRAYDLEFGAVRDLDPAIMYDALAKGEVDVICAFATDGRIAAFDLRPLRDDRNHFLPYLAAPVVRSAALAEHPELDAVLALLDHRIDDQTMRSLNAEVDIGKKTPKEVARDFLVGAELLLDP